MPARGRTFEAQLTLPPAALDVVLRSTALSFRTTRDLRCRAAPERSRRSCALSSPRLAAGAIPPGAAARARHDAAAQLDHRLRAHRAGGSDPARRRGGGRHGDAASLAHRTAAGDLRDLRLDAEPA